MNVKEKLYMFNPFLISNATEQEIANTYSSLQESLNEETDTPFMIAHNIEVYSNMCYLLGEMIARLTEQYDKAKVAKDIEENQALYMLRDQWKMDNDEKPPAIAYFEAKAKQTVVDQYNRLADLGARLYRFKKAYESTENKANALKKKMEAIKYEM